MNETNRTPFYSLGNKLKAYRQRMKESLAEVSGAVEIEIDLLENIEYGKERPSEDVLMLMISHFGVQDDEATTLWQLAGYDQPRDDQMIDEPPRSVMVMMTLDARILYSDGAHIAADRNGVVFSFSQNSGDPKNPRLPIARIGMSYEQVRDFSKVLNDTLAYADNLRQPKRLAAPNKNHKPNEKKSN